MSSCSNEVPPDIPLWAPIICALIASAVRGMTGFADGLVFQSLWAFLTASAFVPTSCGALRKAVLYSTIMQAVTLPIQVWATRNHLRAIFAYIASMSITGSTTVFVGAALLYSDAALKLRIFAGVFFCFVSAVQLTAGAISWLDKLSEQAENEDNSPKVVVPIIAISNEQDIDITKEVSLKESKITDNVSLELKNNNEDASYHLEQGKKETKADNKELVKTEEKNVSSPIFDKQPESLPIQCENDIIIIQSHITNPIEAWFKSPQGLLYFPIISPVLSPAPLLAVLCSAALCAGVLNGMIGAGGPPMMLVYSFINLDKEVLRGFGIVPSVFMVLRFIAYVAYPGAVFDIKGEWALYLFVGIASGAGSQFGNYFRKYATGPSLMRAILSLVWLSGGSMLEALGKSAPAAIFFSLTSLWLFVLAFAAAVPLSYSRVMNRFRRKQVSTKPDTFLLTIPGQKSLVIGASILGASLAIIAIIAATFHIQMNSSNDTPIA
jgi:hypothetical protein